VQRHEPLWKLLLDPGLKFRFLSSPSIYIPGNRISKSRGERRRRPKASTMLLALRRIRTLSRRRQKQSLRSRSALLVW
jgi:hypothetical protein